jgi:hypothetical protein
VKRQHATVDQPLMHQLHDASKTADRHVLPVHNARDSIWSADAQCIARAMAVLKKLKEACYDSANGHDRTWSEGAERDRMGKWTHG